MAIQSTSTLRPLLRRLGCLAALSALVIGAVASVEAQSQCAEHGSRSLVFHPNSNPYGVPLEAWAVRYVQWTSSFPATEALQPPFREEPEGVWLLSGVSGGGSATRQLTVPPNTGLFISLISVRWDNVECPVDTNFTVAELFENARADWEAISELSLTVDGAPVGGLSDHQSGPYLLETGPFAYTVAECDNQLAAAGYTCIPDGATISPTVNRGVFLMVKPLPPGEHVIHARGAAGPVDDPFYYKDVVYKITVLNRSHR